MKCTPPFLIVDGEDNGPGQASCCAPTLGVLDGVEITPGGGGSTEETIEIVLPASTFVTDTRSSYDGLIGGNLAGGYVAIPGNGIPDRAFYFTQSDGTAQQGFDPQDFEAALVGYTMVAVPLAAGLQTEVNVGTALDAAISAFGDYTVNNLGNGTLEVTGNILAAGVFTGGSGSGDADAARNRGQSGLWGIRIHQLNLFGSYGEGPVNATLGQAATAPALGSTRVYAMDVFIGAVHNAGDQFRLALYEGGGAVDPTGAVLLHDFGQIAGNGTNQWVRIFVPVGTAVEPGNASQLWMFLKSNANLTFIGGIFTGSGGAGNLADQDFWQSSSMSTDAAVAYEAAVPAGGAHGSTFICAMRIIYQSAPFAADGSWVRQFGVHADITTAPNAAPIASQLMMGANPPNVLGMRLDYVDMPYGTVHDNAGGQWRLAAHQGGVLLNPDTATLENDLGQTAGTATLTQVRLSAPAAGDPSEVSINNTDPLWWTGKNNNVVLGVGSEVAFQNGGGALVNPIDNPMDWIVPAGLGTGSEYELFPTNPTINPNPAVGFPATVTTDATDLLPGNVPWARLGLRINGIRLMVIP